MRISGHIAVRAFIMIAAAAAASSAFVLTGGAQAGVSVGQAVQPDPATSQSPASTEAAERASRAGAQKNGVTCRTEFSRMRDGTMLATDVYEPAKPGRYPVIMQRTPYGLRLGHGCGASLSGNMAFWAENGYVGLTQDVRGTFRSEGQFEPFFQEQQDGYDAVEWAAVQPWSNGRVALTGTSYFGVTQWQAALMAPPSLVAIAPGQTATDYHDHWTYVNGVFDLWFAQSWILTFFSPDAYRRQLMAAGSPPVEALARSEEYLAREKGAIYRTWVNQVPLASFPEYRTLAPYYYQWLAHPDYDAYWAKVDVEAQWAKIKVPALIHGAWTDAFAIGSVRSFEGMRDKAGSATARKGSRLVMFTGGHGGFGVLNYESAPTVDIRALQLRFYDHHVKGVDNGIDRDPPLQLFVQVPPESGPHATGFWVDSPVFPLAGTEKLRFNLRSGGRANTRLGDGVLDSAKPSQGPDDTFRHDPSNPVPSWGGGLCCVTLGVYHDSGAQDQSQLELRQDVLSYTSAPLEKDLAVVGPVKVRFWAKSSARDTDFVVKLVDVRPSGFAQNILERVIRARYRRGSKLPPELMRPRLPYEFDLELGYAGSLFKAGHSVRIDIASSKFPHLARNQSTGGPPAKDARMEVAENTILHNSTHSSYLELSVVPGLGPPR